MKFWQSLPQIVRQVLLGTLIFFAGSALSFAYSYRPLHGSLTFKVTALEARIDERNRENLALRDEITVLKSGESSCIEPEELEDVKRELGRVQYALSLAESEVERSEGHIRDANANADRWRKRFRDIEKVRSETRPAAPAPIARPVPVQTPRPAPEPSAPIELNSSGRSPEPVFNESDDAGFDALRTPSSRPIPSVDAGSPNANEGGILLPSDSVDPY